MLPQQIIFTRRSFSSPFLQSIRAAHNSTTLGIVTLLAPSSFILVAGCPSSDSLSTANSFPFPLPVKRAAIGLAFLRIRFQRFSSAFALETSWTLRFNAARLAAATCYQQWFTKLRNTTSHL
ncbi:hypothetical protein MIND_00009200 [Mycena indigotica]|uniref:Uncharacterized protein n=1 Tax=Mycena indigotica TaxID=2126181 RepID=A0A8H6TE09_9AGAR|nr:uncharacterized protein MIND_00009200 [Mycena indigotica]KAF7314952.1 hypothetical protein MIND_00009200 [Mycena indigotica]